jgi:hypothetical protein
VSGPVVHSWSTPDPDEYEPDVDTDTMVCTEGRPFTGQRGIKKVYHPQLSIFGDGAAGFGYMCRWCGTTSKGASADA